MTQAHDPAPRYALIGLAGLVLTLVLGLVLAAAFAFAFRHSEGPALAPIPSRPPPPRLETGGGQDLARVRADGARRLSAWGWVDRRAGVARIPIGRAMALTAQQGWDAGATRP
jgi:hypothetical protein